MADCVFVHHWPTWHTKDQVPYGSWWAATITSYSVIGHSIDQSSCICSLSMKVCEYDPWTDTMWVFIIITGLCWESSSAGRPSLEMRNCRSSTCSGRSCPRTRHTATHNQVEDWVNSLSAPPVSLPHLSAAHWQPITWAYLSAPNVCLFPLCLLYMFVCSSFTTSKMSLSVCFIRLSPLPVCLLHLSICCTCLVLTPS